MNSYTIGVVIRCYNEGKYLRKCITALKHLNNPSINKLRILIIDSGSDDDTLEIAREMNCEIIEIKRKFFNYGGTLNVGFEYLNDCKFIVSLSAHAIPVNETYLENLVSPFMLDDKIAATFSKQEPWPNAEIREKVRIHETFKTSKIIYKKNSIENLIFSNVSSCIKREKWNEYNFSLLPAAEDREWARYMINKGYFIVYSPDSIVIHSHNDTPTAYVKRLINITKVHNDMNYKDYLFLAAANIKMLLKCFLLEQKDTRNFFFMIYRAFCETFLFCIYPFVRK